VQSPAERFLRYIAFDSSVDLTMQDLMARGFRPAVDFGCIYGLLPLLINRAWYGVAGLSPGAFRAEVVLGTCLTAWGMARFARARRVGPAGLALIILAMPDVLFPSYSTIVHVLEPALLVHGLAEQASGRRATALALATASCFVKPAMGYVYGLSLLIAIAAASKGQGRSYWLRSLGPAAAVAAVLATILAAAFGVGAVVEQLIPLKGSAVYRLGRFGFFHGLGREFWILPGAGVWEYFRYEVGFWLLGSLWLVWGGITALVRLSRGESTVEEARDDEVVACCATLHAVFVTCFFGLRTSWTYYFSILILGLAARAKGSRTRVAVAWCLAALLLVNDRSKLLETYRGWALAAPSRVTLGLWATPAERAEWGRVLELTRGEQPALLAAIDGSVSLLPSFAPPAAAYFCPGLTLPVEARRKADQLASARLIVAVVRPDWEGFTLWPELAAALDGCELLFEGTTFRVYRRFRPPLQRVHMSFDVFGDARNGLGRVHGFHLSPQSRRASRSS
jgi:hypothetical protein